MHSIPLNDLRRHNAQFQMPFADAFASVSQSGWYILGREVLEFEAAFARSMHSPHCVSVANGTDALEIAMRAIGIKPGDLVATAANAGAYTTSAILAIGARPTFYDISPKTLGPDTETLRAWIAMKPKAVVVTHLYGHTCPVDQFTQPLRDADIFLVEDCAQSHGASIQERLVGTFGDVATFSFYPTKNLGAIGDGGAIVTSSATVDSAARELRQYGWNKKYQVSRTGGCNSRLDEVQASILLHKLNHLSTFNAKRFRVLSQYSAGISHPEIRFACPLKAGDVAHLAVIRTQKRLSLQRHLAASGVATDIHYPIPDHQQPAFMHLFSDTCLPETESAAREVLSIPCFPELTEEEIVRVIESCNSWRP